MNTNDGWDWLEDELQRRRESAEFHAARRLWWNAEQQRRNATKALQDACGHHNISYHRFRQSNGVDQVRGNCVDCGHSQPHGKPSLSKADVLRLRLVVDVLPLVRPRLERTNPCDVCGDENTELHHWAPRHLFGFEADAWPTSWLCRACHIVWHRVVTPNMNRRKAS